MKMNIWQLLKNILPFVMPYKLLIAITLVLTFVGSLMAQVNAVVLDRAVDEVYRQGGLYKDIFDASARSMNADRIAATTY